MIPKEHDDHRLFFLPEVIKEGRQVLIGVPDRTQIVFQNALLAVGELAIAVINKGILGAPPTLRTVIGAMALVAHIEGKIGFAGFLVVFIEPDDLREKHLVHGHFSAGELLIIIFHKVIVFKPQVPVDIFPVIEPLETGVAALHRIALIPEVPRVGIGVGAEIAQLAVAGEEAPLGVHRAPGEDIGHKVSGNAFLLQLVVFLIGVIGQIHLFKPAEIVVGLQHDGDHIDLFVLGDVGVLIIFHEGRGGILVVALGRTINGVGNAVEEGIDKASGNIDLGVRPGADEFRVVGGCIVAVQIVIDIFPAEKKGDDEHGQSTPCAHQGMGLAPQEEEKQHRHRQHSGQGPPHSGGGNDLILPRHVPGFPHQKHIGKQQWIVAQSQFEPVDKGAAQNDNALKQKGQPGPSQKEIQQRSQQKHRKHIEKDDERKLKIAFKHLPAVFRGGKSQADHSHPKGGGRINQAGIHPKKYFFPGAPAFRRFFLKNEPAFPASNRSILGFLSRTHNAE